MLVLFTKDHQLHYPKFEYYDGEQVPHAEHPDRIAKILSACRRQELDVREVSTTAAPASINKLHNLTYIEYLREKCATIRNEDQIMPSVYIRDTYTPLLRHTYEAALKSAQLALMAADELVAGTYDTIYALCRPPGHHAESNAMMGYCYFNNAALAADKLSLSGKVAILDIDYHHGNGTQHLFYARNDILYVSLHADPTTAFPYDSGFADEHGKAKGSGFNHNFPLVPETTVGTYLETLEKAMGEINNYRPDYVVLSLGFDTYEDDPIGGLGITEQAYITIGNNIAATLGYPMIIVQEGGYNVSKLGILAENFLIGYKQGRSSLRVPSKNRKKQPSSKV